MSAANIELETVNVRIHDGVATIELNRPQALNAWNAQFGSDLLRSRLLFGGGPEGHQRRR